VTVRILPLLQTGPGAFERADDFEVAGLFVFHGPLQPPGSSSDPVNFNIADGSLFRILKEEDPDTGETRRVRVAAPYIFAALIGLLPRNEVKQVEIGGVQRQLSYGEVVDALQSAITVHSQGGAAGLIDAYDLSDDNEAVRLRTEIKAAWDAAGPPPLAAAAAQQNEEEEEEDEGIFEIDPATLSVPDNPDLLGVDPSVYRQINALLHSGKQHIMLYGPPGTGKTTLARWVAENLPGGELTLVTGSSDWSSQDIIGGYQPVGDGDVDFVPGILLRNFDRPLIIDELNRCDIDKVIGPLFTVLSGQQTTLPYRTKISDKNSQPYVILPRPKAGASDYEFAPGPAWRLIATINSIDKASLYQMSYALSRRFGWVYVDVPGDLRGFIADYIALTDPAALAPAAGDSCPLADVWMAINTARPIGSAPIIDAIAAIRALAPGEAFFGAVGDGMRRAALDALDMVLLPMLDGIVLQDAHNIADAIVASFALSPEQATRVKARLKAVAI
jgi:MoxR-like ATPase